MSSEPRGAICAPLFHLSNHFLHSVECLAKPLEMHNFTFTQELKRTHCALVVAYSHNRFVAGSCLLFRRHVVRKIGNRVSGTGDISRSPIDGAVIAGKCTATVRHYPTFHSCCPYFLTSRPVKTTHKHCAEHFPVSKLLRALRGSKIAHRHKRPYKAKNRGSGLCELLINIIKY